MDRKLWLDQCRENFGDAPRAVGAALRNHFAFHRPRWAREARWRVQLEDQHRLMRYGDLVWGWVVSGSRELRAPGVRPGRGESVVYGLDPRLEKDVGPLELADRHIGEIQIGETRSGEIQLGESQPGGSDGLSVADGFVRSARDSRREVRVPSELVGGHELLWTDVVLPREYLPFGFLASPCVPIVVLPGRSQAVLPLPWTLWSEGLLQHFYRCTVARV